jgi:hypothetical protein
MTFHSSSPREAEMLSVSPDENLAIPMEKRKSTNVAQTIWYMIPLLVGVVLFRRVVVWGRRGAILRSTKLFVKQ